MLLLVVPYLRLLLANSQHLASHSVAAWGVSAAARRLLCISQGLQTLHVLRVLYMAGPTHVLKVWPTEEDMSTTRFTILCSYRLASTSCFVHFAVLVFCLPPPRRFLFGALSIQTRHCSIVGYSEPQPAAP
jgi:hypothetical protein